VQVANGAERRIAIPSRTVADSCTVGASSLATQLPIS
jgi:hypothetical protein